MMNTQNTVEHAFHLARSGEVRSMDELRRELKRQGHESVEEHLAGGAIRKQLAEVLRDARSRPPNPAV